MDIVVTSLVVIYVAIGIIVYGWICEDASAALELALCSMGVALMLVVAFWPVIVLTHIGSRLATRPAARGDQQPASGAEREG